MNTKTLLVSGLFSSRAAAEAAIGGLFNSGISQEDVSVLAAGEKPTGDFTILPGSKLGSGAAIGAGMGGALGALLGGMTAVGALVTGGAALIAAGPLVAALAGAGAGAAAGGLVGGLIGLGIPENEVKYYADRFEKGAMLVGVRTDVGGEPRVRELFKLYGADRVSTGTVSARRGADAGDAGAGPLGAIHADDWAGANPLRRLFVDQLRDIYYAEHQWADSMEQMESNSSAPDLARAFGDHGGQTRQHIARLESIFELIGVKPEQRKCHAINGIIAEAKELTKLDDTLSQRDAAMICAAQKAEHYEIGTYGCLRTYAETLGLREAASLLEETLREEWDADHRLTELAQAGINERAKVVQPV